MGGYTLKAYLSADGSFDANDVLLRLNIDVQYEDRLNATIAPGASVELAGEGTTPVLCDTQMNMNTWFNSPWANVRKAHPPLGNFGDLYFQKPYTLSCSDQLVCTYIAGAFAVEGQLKVGTSIILGVGVTFSKWGWYGHLQISGILQMYYAGQDEQVQLPNTFQKHHILSLEINSKKRLKQCLFGIFLPRFHKRSVLSSQMSTKPPHSIYLNYKQPLFCIIKQKWAPYIGCSSVILRDCCWGLTCRVLSTW